jgi:omega-6 fatty acid desaturase (delta-12 desaturase)
MAEDNGGVTDELNIHSLRKSLMQYAEPDLQRAILQLVNTFIPYIALWAILVYMVR